MMRVFYGSKAGNVHHYQCVGDRVHVGGRLCIGIGSARVGRAVAARILEAVSPLAVEAAIQAAERFAEADRDVYQALAHEHDLAHDGRETAEGERDASGRERASGLSACGHLAGGVHC